MMIPVLLAAVLVRLAHECSGMASFYDPTGASEVSCRCHFGSGDMIVALTSSRWNGADWRGRQVCIRYGGASVTATVRDTCPGCSVELDLTDAVAGAINGNYKNGGLFDITWDEGPCSGGAPPAPAPSVPAGTPDAVISQPFTTEHATTTTHWTPLPSFFAELGPTSTTTSTTTESSSSATTGSLGPSSSGPATAPAPSGTLPTMPQLVVNRQPPGNVELLAGMVHRFGPLSYSAMMSSS